MLMRASGLLRVLFGSFASLLVLGGCALSPAPTPLPGVAPIRFLLSFDDGPSDREGFNPTRSILDDLAHNPVQPGIKALFFVQTRTPAGLSAQGRALLQREQREGHVLGFHTATSWHAGHRFISSQKLEQSLRDGIADIAALGSPPTLVRPPFWNYDARTFATYRAHGMQLLLTDLSANDGKTWGIHGSWRRHSHLRSGLARLCEEIRAGALPTVDGVIPIVVTFHDLNTYTARHLPEYLQILLDSAAEVGLSTAPRPFYDQREALERAALARTLDDGERYARLPGIWNWLWH